MNHQQAEELFLEFLDHRISEVDGRLLATHLDRCEQCRDALVEYREVMRLERVIAGEAHLAGPLFGEEVMESIERERTHISVESSRKAPQSKSSGAAHFWGAVSVIAVVAMLVFAVYALNSIGTTPDTDYQTRRIVGTVFEVIEGAGGATVMLLAALIGVVAFVWPHRSWRRRFAYSTPFLMAGVTLFMARAATSLFFGADYQSYDYAEPSAEYGTNDSYPDITEAFEKDIGAQRRQDPGEHYRSYLEQGLKSVSSEPLSTFSIDVDTGSYSNVRRFLSQGQLPPPNAVRAEEMLNYFSYAYPSPSEAPIGVSYEMTPSPFDEGKYLLRVGMKARAAKPLDGGWNLVFLVDISGSMDDEQKLPLLRSSLLMLVDSMRAVDRVAIVTYASSAGVLLESTSGAERERIRDAIGRMVAGGSTNGGDGIQTAYRLARQHRVEGGVNRIILATDGDFNVGTTSFEELVALVERERADGISLTTMGFGAGNYKEENLEQLADKGNGNYFYIDSIQEGERVVSRNLVANMETVAKDVKVQLEFNPTHVSHYRLLGYDNRALASEDFANDRVDAGEMGAGHTVTALYEIRLAGEDRSGAPHSNTIGAEEFGFMEVRYKEPNGSESKKLSYPITGSVQRAFNESTKDYRFAVAVAYFGGVLGQKEFAKGVDLRRVATIVSDAIAGETDPDRAEFLRLVQQAARLRGESLPVASEQLRYKRTQ